MRGKREQISLPSGHAFWAFPETVALAGLFRKAGRGHRGCSPREHLARLKKRQALPRHSG
jgi:hypothetical protein